MRASFSICLLLVAVLSFAAGGLWFGKGEQAHAEQAGNGAASVVVGSDQAKADGDLLLPRGPALGMGLVHAETASPERVALPLAGREVEPTPDHRGLFAEYSKVQALDAFSENEMRNYLDRLVVKHLFLDDPKSALRVLDQFGRGLLKDKYRYQSIALKFANLELAQEAIALNIRLAEVMPGNTRTIYNIARDSIPDALSVLRANLHSLEGSSLRSMRVVEANLLLRMGLDQQARNILSSVLQEDPENYYAIEALGMLDPAEASAILEALHGRDPSNWAGVFAELLVRNGQEQRAVSVLLDALAESKLSDAHMDQLLELAPVEGYNYLVSVGKPQSGDGRSCQAWFEAADALEQAGYLSMAIHAWEAVLVASPGLEFQGFGELQKNAPEILVSVMKAKVGESKHTETLELLALSYWSAGQLNEAIAVYEKCAALEQGWSSADHYKRTIEDIQAGESPDLW